MASYIILANFTSVGIRNVKATTQRAKDFRNQTEKVGIKEVGFFLEVVL